jgi:UDP-glucose 4-epimerase
LGNGSEITINELAQEVKAVVGQANTTIVHEAPRPGDVLRLYANTTKSQQLLGFKPQVTLHKGLTKLKEWYLSIEISPEILLKQEVVYNWQSKGSS